MTTTSAERRSPSPVDVLALQYVQPTRMLLTPLTILLGVVVVMILVTITIVRLGGSASDTEYNGALIWSTVGYVVAIGVQVVATSFPLALAFGTTRRTFVVGNLLTVAVQALLLTAAALVLLGLELATGGWFVGARVLSDATLGGGNAIQLGITFLLGSLTALSIGGVFGAAWVRFGPRGPLVLSLVIVLAVALVLLLLLPAIIAAFAAFQPWWIAIGMGVVVLLSLGGQYLLLRRAIVR